MGNEQQLSNPAESTSKHVQKLKDSPSASDGTPNHNPNVNTSAPSESQPVIVRQDSGSASGDVNHSLDVTPNPSPHCHPEPLSDTPILKTQTAAVENRLASPSVGKGDELPGYGDYDSLVRSKIETAVEVISAFTETGKAESSIQVPLQRKYTGENEDGPRREVISSALANVPCASLGIQGILDLLNAILETSHTLDTPSVSSLLEDCITQNYDFGAAYGRLRRVWKSYDGGTMQDELRKHEEGDWKMRREALAGNRIVEPDLPPRRVWDLYSNRVVPYWVTEGWPEPISHAWVDEKDRVDVWTPINGKKWPVPIPNDADLRLIRIEMLNLGYEYTWLDVLCLRQVGGLREDLRVEEWKLDVPTIGRVYRFVRVVIYLSGLGQPLILKEGDLESDRSWFRCAWTVQEVGSERIIAGDTPDGPMHARPIDEDGNYEIEILTQFHRQLKSFQRRYQYIFSALADMQKRVSTNPVDKVAGLAFPLWPKTIPAYHESESLEEAWTVLVNTMRSVMRVDFLFLYPEAGQGCKKWRPTWEQVMMNPLPEDVDSSLGDVGHDDVMDEDWYEGPCIQQGLVQGLDKGSAEGGDRFGELVVEDEHGMACLFKIIATHQYPIPKDSYTLLGNDGWPSHWAIGRQLPDQRFEKVSVFAMINWKETKMLKGPGITVKSHNILV
ncbi:uncharacterized protein EV420DRAFT_792183 [Desarmillaria tabescens]|uniref:Heterokaryon incompatibility domain-containing protein n=1 Tax=Armillaria tabescens TaxID=1929756 RepID=A0AA39JYU3_ARMTA|nr:uncharacterized protein EV420DRAFT_792183 [Desarmillaria tabescens]KAK0449098.1 hypothetical protein EV420DRAFT_792183 [Desarmillaria tabescens]